MRFGIVKSCWIQIVYGSIKLTNMTSNYLNFVVYLAIPTVLKCTLGQNRDGTRQVGIGNKVCMNLMQSLLHQGRTLFVDNFHTSYELARSLLKRKTHLVGTLHANRKHLPKVVMQAKLKRGEIVAREDQKGIVLLKWKDVRDVRVLSTKHKPELEDPREPEQRWWKFAKKRKKTMKQRNQGLLKEGKEKGVKDRKHQLPFMLTTKVSQE